MNTLPKVTSEQLEAFIGSPERAVDLVRDLLWAEASRQGLNPLNVSVSEKIYAKDGGVDGTSINIKPKREGLLFKGITYYQIKSGRKFDPCNEKCLRKELLNKSDLKPGLKNMVEDKGTYVLIWFGGAFIGNQDHQCTNLIKAIFSEKGATGVSSVALDRTKLAKCCDQHSVIQAEYFNNLAQRYLTLEQWLGRYKKPKSKTENPEQISLKKLGEEASYLRKSVLKTPYRSVQILSKETNQMESAHMIYQALNSDGLKQKTICVDAANLQPPLSSTLEGRDDLNQILVIDNCKKEYHPGLLAVLGQRSKRLGMIVLSVDSTIISDDRFNLIGEQPTVTVQSMERSVSKQPTDRVVHVSKTESVKVPEQKTINLPRKTKAIYESIRESEGHAFLSAARRFLRFVALFSKVGSETNVNPDLSFVAKKLGYSQPDKQLELAEIIHILRNRKLIDGQYYLKIADQKHRLFLIQEWWTIYGSTIDFKSLLEDIYSVSEHLAQRLLDSLPYITATDNGKRLAQALLGESGFFTTGQMLKEGFGSQLFGKLAEADPETALTRLKRTIGTWTRNELLEFTTGRREVIWALEKIVIWRDLFVDGAQLLLALGESENEDYGNNASGVFAGLFSPGYGAVAPTEASPHERFTVLKEALESKSKEKRQLALDACDVALETMHFTRMVGAENQGLRKKPELWTPKTYGEIFDAYRSVWKLLESKLGSLVPDEQSKVVTILLGRIRGLVRIQSIADMVFDTIKNLATKPHVDKKQVLSEIISLLYYDKDDMPPKICKQWEGLRDQIIGTGFHSRMERFVGMALIQDQYDDKGTQPAQTKQQIKKLAKEALRTKGALDKELFWLVTEEAKNGFLFGYELGKQDKKQVLLSGILKAQKKVHENASLYFLGGYLKALCESSRSSWDNRLDALAKDKKTAVWIPELTWRSGLSDKSVLRILELAEKGYIGVDHFHIFGYGDVIKRLSEKVFALWINYLIDSKKASGALITLNLYNYYYIFQKHDKKLPKDLTLKVLLNSVLLKPIPRNVRDQMAEHNWTEIGKKYVKLFPKDILGLGKEMLTHFNEDDTIFDGLHSQTQKVLNDITSLYPEEIWKEVANYLGPPIDARAYHLKEWLRGGSFFDYKEGAISSLPPSNIWRWVDENIEKRAWYLATFVPKILFRDKKRMCWAREVLVRYGDREGVKRNLIANFSTEGWSGPESQHLEGKKKKLLKYETGETNNNVLRWIDEYVEILDQRIKQARIEEEGRDF